MNQVIEVGDKIYAMLCPVNNVFGVEKNKTEWFGKSYEPLQGSRMYYDKGKTFRGHKHILNPRTIKRTQEAFVVITGSIQIDVHDSNKSFLGSLVANDGDVIFIWDGFHTLSVLKDASVFYEIKAGQFTCVSEDKEFID